MPQLTNYKLDMFHLHNFLSDCPIFDRNEIIADPKIISDLNLEVGTSIFLKVWGLKGFSCFTEPTICSF